MRVHFAKDDDSLIAYFPDSMRFFEITEKTQDLICSYKSGEDKTVICDKYDLSPDEYDTFIKKIEAYATPDQSVEGADRVESGKKVLGRLVMNVSNTCNLECRYCYANGGSYCSDEGLMSRDVVDKTLDVFYKAFDIIKTIQIFGGEPLLNIEAVEQIGSEIEKKFAEGSISEKPVLGLVSNGTILNDKVIELIKRFNIKLTISLDGPAFVNDAMRVFPDKKGTSHIIEHNIKAMKKETGQPEAIEVTYNKHHIENKLSLAEIIHYIKKEFEITAVHIAPASGAEGADYLLNDYTPFVDSIEDIFRSRSEGNPISHTYVERFMESLKKKKTSKCLCDAGISTISVSINGDIYPCFMFTDNEKYKLGNVFDKDVFSSDIFLNKTACFKSFSKLEHEQCKDCFINNICFGCLGMNFIENEDLFKTSHKACAMYKSMMEKILLNLVKAKKAKAGNKG